MKTGKFLMVAIALLSIGLWSCKKDVESVSIRPEAMELQVGETYQMSAVVLPSDADQMVEWTSSRTSVATVSETGLVTAVAEGTCDITVYAADKSAVCHLTVVARDPNNPNNPNDPSGGDNATWVVTNEPTDVGFFGATLHGSIINQGQETILRRGFCWSTSPNPTTAQGMSENGTGFDAYTVTLNNLEPNTTYYVRAYAVNSNGTFYGTQKTFTTLDESINYQTGTIHGVFAVSNTKAVAFSQGNLQYQASTNTWRFAANQYDIIGSSNSSISSSYSGYIDLFGWGTSGWNSGANAYYPYSTSTSSSDYYPGGSYSNSLTGSYANADWGVYNAISNGGSQAGMWRTLTSSEWGYLFNSRPNASSKYGEATVNGVTGMVLLPDNWTLPSGCTFTAGYGNGFTTNTYTTAQWTSMQSNGAVFLPAAGYRYGTEVGSVGTYGGYWSSTYSNSGSAYSMYFGSVSVGPSGSDDRNGGQSVRLVQDN